ncbi:adenylate/guanylate cyclase domain-containing protein [Bradyrhizobium sp. AZCC 1693]|uniref:adenylate/guanylate cyclase domain-containing protein n=1 Tax=Bradyrhizobium sp. AZCC 1693 TaxID=3117029 RepID=UPI002FF08F20
MGDVERRRRIPITLGLHVGNIVVGNIGSADRKNYTVLDATVNLAARKALVSDQIILRAEAHFLFRSVDRISPKGFAEKIPIFEIRCTRECASESEDSSATSGKESTRRSMPEISRTRSSWWKNSSGAMLTMAWPAITPMISG